MVLPSLFRKSSKSAAQTPIVPKLAPGTPAAAKSSSSPGTGTPPSSPEKKSHRVKERERSERRSSSYTSKRSSKLDRTSHPLNLPPDELRRLSSVKMSAMADQPTPQPMDIDREFTASPSPPKSPAPAQAPAAVPKQPAADDSRPAPPPHRYTTSPPPDTAKYAATPEESTPPAQPPTIDAEEYKNAGNKFFKIKDYPTAIREYSKGASCSRYTLAESRAASCRPAPPRTV